MNRRKIVAILISAVLLLAGAAVATAPLASASDAMEIKTFVISGETGAFSIAIPSGLAGQSVSVKCVRTSAKGSVVYINQYDSVKAGRLRGSFTMPEDAAEGWYTFKANCEDMIVPIAAEAYYGQTPPEDSVDFTALIAKINAVGNTARGDYTDTSWNAFQSALATAQDVANNGDATQAQVDDALTALTSAFSWLARQPVHKNALNTKISAVRDTAKGDYTDESWEAFRNALAVAQAMAGSAAATQQQVDNALSMLTATYSGLAHKPAPGTYTVAYNASGGTGAPAPQTKTQGATLTLSSTEPVKKGYRFLGWTTRAGAATVAYVPGGAYSADAGATLYAVWQAHTYTVTFDANGGTVTPANITVAYGSAYSALPAPVHASLYFDGWHTEVSGGARISKTDIVILTGDTTFYAHWTAVRASNAGLLARIGELNGLPKGDYTDDSWDALQTSLRAAQAAANDGSATQADFDGALAALNQSFHALRKKALPGSAVILVRKQQNDVFKALIASHGAPLRFESTGIITVDGGGRISYKMGAIGKATVTAYDAATGAKVDTVPVEVKWTWHWFLVIFFFGWLYL
ncbi:MAG: InlB B-repeat-containing protein [Oscillospiraceae bacterium]|jgi:uncharacterized repeat protein (TIGR02543 family)|nr:InlB B-repeat-containing protein [Oscillospiraceae bacterium]